MMEELDELRPPTAWRLLEIWRGTRELAEEPLERALLCNAQVLAESCLRQGKCLSIQRFGSMQFFTTSSELPLARKQCCAVWRGRNPPSLRRR